MPRRLLVITPCRDEEEFVARTLQAVVAQERRPDRWILVDDASGDRTAEIVAEWAERHSWIELVRRRRSGQRELGPGVVAAFGAGLDHAGDDPWDVIAKLDADLDFDTDCFSRILALFDDPAVGMASGTTRLLHGAGGLRSERYATYHVPGQAKFYRRACFEQIGGLPPLYGWDILDETEARRHGWRTLSDPGIEIRHHRLQGAALGTLRGRFIWGRAAWAIGSHPLFAVARGVYRFAEPPWVIGGLALIAGFFYSYVDSAVERNRDAGSIAHLRREQLYRLTHGNRLPPASAEAA